MCLAIFFGIAAILPAFALAAAPREGSLVAVVTVPWAGEAAALRVVVDADARIVSRGRYSWLTIVRDQEGRPELTRRLYDAGAMAVLSAEFVSACLDASKVFWSRTNE
jgi:hypothetical protein